MAPYAPDPVIPADPVMPPGRPRAASTTALDRVTAPVRQAGAEETTPFSTLTGQPAVPQQPAPGVPFGSYPSPYYTDGPECCGPTDRNGLIGTEIYTDTGVSIPFGAGDFVHRLEAGWMVGAGGRSLFFNRAHDAAWTVELGWSYQYNRGDQNNPTMLNVRQANTTNATTGLPQAQPDVLTNLIVRDVIRNNLNFGFGRDWWLWGPGATGLEHGWNLRVGALVGGRYGTAHVDELPFINPADIYYFRRQGTTTGIYFDFHANCEVPLGSVIFFAGLQVQYGYDWTNIAPPYAGDIQNVNIMIQSGFRF
jgi:hypothetical protein